MPRGRPRKNSTASDEVLAPKTPSDVEGSSSSSRPARKRIAVRKFGCGTDEEASLPSSSGELPQQQSAGISTSGKQPGSGYVLIHKSFWGDLTSKLACSSCGKRSVQMKTEKLSGLACKLLMYCTCCGVVLSQVTTSADDGDEDAEEDLDFEVNRRFVQFFVKEGKTYDDVVVFSRTLGLPIISKTMFERYRDELS